MRWSRGAVPALVLCAAATLAGCGTNEASTAEAYDGDPGFVTSSPVVFEEGKYPLGEYVEWDDTLRIRADVVSVDSDESAVWMNVAVRVDNNGPHARAMPALEFSCAESGTGTAMPDYSGSTPRRVDAHGSVEVEMRLQLSSNGMDGGPIPPCEGRATLWVIMQESDGSASLGDVWSVPDRVVNELNASRPVLTPSPAPGPIADPDRPYAWVDQDQYSSGYQVVVVTRTTAEAVRRTLGLGAPADVEGVDEAVIVAEHSDGVVLFTLFGYLPQEQVQVLSRGGLAASYSNTVEGDDHILVARDGKVVRSFNPFLGEDYVKSDPLPEEKGLDLEDDTWAASWTLLERLTKIHITEEWLFGEDHPAYLMKD